MVSEALDGLTDEQLADLELQESGLVSGQNEGAIASTPFAQRMNPTSAPEPEPEAPVALSDYELNKLEEENYRRTDYVMTPQEFDQYWDRREKEDNEVGRFLDGLGQGAAGLVGMVPEAANEITGALIRGVQDPIGQAKQNIQTGAEIIRKGGINLVQLFDWVSNKYDDLATSSKRAEVINAGIRSQLEADGRLTGDRERDEQIYQAALVQAREAGAYTPTADQVREDRQKAYERYVREMALERDFAAVTDFKTGESQMSVPTSAEDYQITDEKALPTVSTLGSMVVDPVNLVPLGAGALSKARALRRIANLSEKPLLGAERVASGLADTAERIELGISTRLQDITGLTSKQQAALGAGVAGTAVYVDSATEGGGGLTKAVLLVGGILPTLHYGGALLRKVGSAAGGTATIVREAGVGGLGVARAEAASNLAGNAAIPERYRKFFTGYVDGTDSTLKRVAQNADNPEALRRVSRFADRMGATQVARVADDAASGAVTAGIVGTPFAALQPDAERAGEVMGGILALGAAGGVAGGFARRAGAAADADIARMFADVQAVGGNVEAFARLPHATLDRLAAMQGVLAGKVDFVPLTGDEYRMNADIAQNGGEATAGVFLDRDANNRARVFINLDGKTATDAIAPHEIGHAILTSNVLDGQPRNDLRNLVNQQYGPDGVEARGREYIARMVDADLRQGVTGEAPTVLTEAEMKAVDGGKTMDDIVADRAKDPAERDRLINERMEEFRQRSIDKGEDAMDWARDEIIAETFASEAPAIDFRAIRRDAMFPRLAESMLSAGGRVLEVFGANLSSTGKLMDNPSVLFRDNPLFQDRIMQKRVREYVRSYDQYLAGLEEAGAKELRGVELARSSKPEDLARSTHVKLRDEGRGVLENDFLFQKPDGTYSLKPQKIITATENARSAQIKTLYDARKFVPVNSQEFGKRKVNGREVIGGPVLPPQFDLFTNFPKHVREFARLMERSREEGGSWDIDYNAIGTGASGRYRVTNLGNVRAIQRETVPYGWIVSKANHLLAASLDLNAFRASAMKAINKGDLGLFNNDMRQVEADLKTYLSNHRNGLPGEATIGQQKRDMLNGLIGTGTAVQRTANPLYSDLNPRGSIRTWRVDRLNDAKPTGRTGYFFDYDKINNNRMPSAIPQAGMAMPDADAARAARYDALQRRIPSEGNLPAVKLKTGHLLTFEEPHVQFLEAKQIDPRDVESGGWVVDGDYRSSGDRSDTLRWAERKLAAQRAQASRAKGQAMPDAPANLTTDQILRELEENQGYLGLSTLGMREGRPVKGGAQQTRELLRRNTALNEELRRRGGPQEESDVERVLRQRGQAMPDVADAPPFYLKSSQAIDAKVQGKAATVDQIKAILTNPQNGIKAEELKWTGVMQEVERLAKENNGKVPKDALLRYLAEDGAVRFEEVRLGQDKSRINTDSPYAIPEVMRYAQENQGNAPEAMLLAIENDGDVYRALGRRTPELLEREDWAQVVVDDVFGGGDNVQLGRYAQYQLPGGKNYREVVLAMPDAKKSLQIKQNSQGQWIHEVGGEQIGSLYPTEQDARIAASIDQRTINALGKARNEGNYRSSHFPDTPNYVAHMRLNERVDAKGKQGLFIEELQSDRHQQGREKGYQGEFPDDVLRAAIDGGMPEAQARRDILHLLKEPLDTDGRPTMEQWDRLSEAVGDRIDLNRVFHDRRVEGVPDAPFRTSWPLQLFKRAMRDAVADGKDWIGWTTGETQAARYDLSKQVAKVYWNEADGGTLTAEAIGGDQLPVQKGVTREKLPDVIGKDAAQRMIALAPDEYGDRTLKGNDLKVGGEGMKGFYDTMVPKEVAKHVKQWGGQVEKGKIGEPKQGTGRMTRDEVAEARKDARQLIRGDISVEEFNDAHGTRFTDDDVPGNDPYQLSVGVQTILDTMREQRKQEAGGSFMAWRVNITPQMREGIKKAGQALFVGGTAAVVAEDQLEQ